MFVKELFEEIDKDEAQREWANPIRLSSTGKCPQQMACKILGLKEKPLPARTKLLFRLGDHVEAEIKKLAEEYLLGKHWVYFVFGDRIEIHDDEEPRVYYKQIEINLPVKKYERPGQQPETVFIKGHFDGIGYKTWDDPYLLEIKSMNSYAFARFCKKQIDKAYLWQVQAYLRATGLKKAIIIAMNKQTSDMAEQIIEYDDSYDVEGRWREILSASTDRVLTRELTHTMKEDACKVEYPCSYCSFVDICYDNVTIEFDKKGRPTVLADMPSKDKDVLRKLKERLEVEDEKENQGE